MVERSITAPRLETERLVLRGYERADFDRFIAISNDPVSLAALESEPMDRLDLWGYFMRGPAFWVLHGYGLWMVEDRKKGQSIGFLGFGEFMRATETGLPDLPEMAWFFDSAVHGQGYASEALGAALTWGDRYIGGAFCCMISPKNSSSIALAERHGFVQGAPATHLGQAVNIYQRETS